MALTTTPPRTTQTLPIAGLSQHEVLARRARGEGNVFAPRASRTYLEILRDNAFTFASSVLIGLGIALLILGRPDDAAGTGGLVLFNVIVGLVQEARAKRKLDQIALLTRPKASVVRDGKEQNVDPAQVVLGDVLVVRPGDQIVVDGEVIGDGHMEVDESLLTGESDLVPKQPGDSVYSGSFCITGEAYYIARKVGAESFANQITAGARTFRRLQTPLQRQVEVTIRILFLALSQLAILFVVSAILRSAAMVTSVQVAAVIMALVPQGLLAMITVSYGMAAIRMAGKGTIVQQASAVESMSHVTVLCLDKTGTLTTNALRLQAVWAIGTTEAIARRFLGIYAASEPGANRTTAAIRAALPERRLPTKREVAFSSDRKWSALVFDDEVLRGTYVLGAPEVLRPALQPGVDLGTQLGEWTARGLRVLLFAYRPDVMADALGETQPVLPTKLAPLALISLSDELRPNTRETLDSFAEAGIELKILSGDNPDTVSSLARQAGLGEIRSVAGPELVDMDEAQLAQVAEDTTVFGRVTPQQKEQLVRLLRQRGQYVAMIGDGVNDVLALKQSQLAVAMENSSQITRATADIVLLENSFAALPIAFREGQRIVRGMHDTMRLLLSRTFYMLLLILGAAIVGVDFPLMPKHNTVVAMLTVGIPTLALVLWARPGKPAGNVVRAIGHFVLPAGVSVAAVALALYFTFLQTTGDLELARTVVTTVGVVCGVILILFVEPPSRMWVGGDELRGDWRIVALAGAMLLLYALVILVPGFRHFLGLVTLDALDLWPIALGVTVWALVLRLAWRRQLLERWVGLKPE